MIIGICALGATSQDTGGQTYLINLYKALKNLDGRDDYVFYVSPGEGRYVEPVKGRFHLVEVNHGPSTRDRLIAEHLRLPRLIRKHGIDVMYYPNNFASWYCPVPYVVAIRSMVYYHYPYAVDRSRRIYRKWMTPHSARKARFILTPSEDIKSDVVRFTNVSPDKIRVIHHGVDVSLFGSPGSEKESEALKKRLGIKMPFLLYVSALWEYKNQDKLIRAFKELQDLDSSGHQLVLVGKGANSFEAFEGRLRRLITELGLDDYVLMPGHLGHDHLRYLYRECDLFVFPSSYESFGNPLFEAMAAGVPVVASNVHSFPEMAGDAALLVDPSDIHGLANALYTGLTDQKLRETLVKAGRKRVAQLSWPKCAEQTSALLNEAAQ